MKKSDEISHENSCFNRAGQDEIMFVLLARDEAAPDTIRMWVRERISRGKNEPHDEQILEALQCARFMEIQRLHRQLGAKSDELPI